MVVLSTQLSRSNSYRPEARSLLGVLSHDMWAVSFFQSVSQGGVWQKANTTSRWSLGRLSLAVGDTETAQYTLSSLPHSAFTNVFVYLDLLQSLPSKRAVELYNVTPPIRTVKAISDTIALAYLEENSYKALPKALIFRSKDLYTNYTLWKRIAQHDTEQARQYFQKLQKFDEEWLTITHPQLLYYTAEIIPLLLADEVWDVETTQAAVSYLVWKYYASESIEQLLKKLIVEYPNTPAWHFLLGELYERNGNLPAAQNQYYETLELASEYIPAIRRLAFLLEERSQQALDKDVSLQAQALLELYLMQKVDDVVTLRSLVVISERLHLSQTADLQERLSWLLDNKSYVVSKLGSFLIDVELGPNLISNGELTQWVQNRPINFIYNTYAGGKGIDGAFAGGRDRLEVNSMRLLTLRTNVTADNNLPYVEYISDKVLVGPRRYIAVIEYCTSTFSMGFPLIYLGQYDVNSSVLLLHEPLPNLDGGCGVARFIVDGPKSSAKVNLVVRNWGKGDLQIRKLSLCEVFIVEG